MENYNIVDQQLHLLSQIITKANRTFVPTKSDDSNTNLYFDSLGNKIVGRWIATPGGSVILALNLENLKFEWVNSSYEVISSFQTVERKMKEIEEDISSHLSELGLDSTEFTDNMHFEIPVYSFTDEVIQHISKTDLKKWKQYRDVANKACASILGYLQIEGEIRIWPHHFDTGIYIMTEKGMGIGFGLAMKDSSIGDPYFYMSGYPTIGSLKLANLPILKFGRWETGENWNGSVLPLSPLVALSDSEKIEAVNSYMYESLQWYLKN